MGLAVADDARPRVADEAAIGDGAAGDNALGEFENLFDLRVADDFFAALRLEQTGHGFLRLVDEFVDDGEQLDLNAFDACAALAALFSVFVFEADDDRVARGSEQHVVLAKSGRLRCGRC
jgi:hypothetical protein